MKFSKSAFAFMALCVGLVFSTACGTKTNQPDVVVNTDVVADIVADIAADVEPDVARDVTPGDVADVPVVNDVADDAVEVIADISVDTTTEFHWAAGCEGTGTGTAWTRISDTTFKRGPFIQMSDRDTALVAWRTEIATTDEGCVDYAYGDQTGSVCGLSNENGQYELAIPDLPASTEVTYSVRVGEVKTVDLTFKTMPDTPMPMKFAVFADAHNAEVPLSTMSGLALAEGVDFAIGNGDFAGEGLREEYDSVFAGMRDLASRVNVWAVPGNHDDKYAERIKEYFGSFVMPQGSEDPYDISSGVAEGWWAKRIGNVWIGGGWVRDFYFSVPDSDWGEVGWFRRQFETEEFKTAQWKLFFIHQPAYSREWGGCDNPDPEVEPYNGEVALRVAMIPMLKAAGIHASFHGHMHGIEYGVVDGVTTIIDGGVCDCGLDSGVCVAPEPWFDPWVGHYGKGSFALVETGCDKMTVRFMGLDGVEIDRIEMPATVAE